MKKKDFMIASPFAALLIWITDVYPGSTVPMLLTGVVYTTLNHVARFIDEQVI